MCMGGRVHVDASESRTKQRATGICHDQSIMAGARITMELLRKSAEHNDGEITTLEELSLHQRDLCRIELLDSACRDLKILLLQNNLIPKIEHLRRLKLLDYLNLALNNIKKVEGLEGCESLRKLDLTVNFIADLVSVESLKNCQNLRELYLTGNPCSQYEGYREYVVATLPQLEQLDGIRITKSERILSMQQICETTKKIKDQSQREIRKEEERLARLASKGKRDKVQKGSAGEAKIVEIATDSESSSESDIDPEEEKRYWEEEDDFTPESRTEAALHAMRVREIEERKKNGEKKKKKPPKRNFFKADGTAYNMNDAGLDFVLDGQFDKTEPLVLDLAVYKYLDTSQLDLDVQPRHVRVTFKNKVFQLALPDEVKPDSAKAERSKISGHLVVTMPKVDQIVKPKKIERRPDPVPEPKPQRELLDVDASAEKIDYTRIAQDAMAQKSAVRRIRAPTRENDDDFVDDDDVPPLA